MSLRARLLALARGDAGRRAASPRASLLVGLTRASLVDRVDRDLLALSGPGGQLQRLGNLAALGQRRGPPARGPAPRPPGQRRPVVPVGLRERPRSPARRCPSTPAGIPRRRLRRRSTSARRSTGRCSYRVLTAARRGRNITLAIAAPLAGVDAAVGGARPDAAAHRRRSPWSGSSSSPGSSSATTCCRSSASRGPPRSIAGGRPHPPGRRPPRQHRGRPARDGVRRDARPDRDELRRAAGGARREGRERGAAAPVRRRRVARAAHAADRGPRLRRPVPGRRPVRPRRARDRRWTRIGTESRRMGALVDDLLLLARLDQGRPVRRDPVDLSRIADDAVADARALEPGRPIAAAIEPGRRRRGRRGPAAPGRRQPARQRPGPHAGRARRSRSSRGPTATTAELRVVDHGPGIDAGRRVERVRPLLPRRSRALARQRRHRPRAVDRGGRPVDGARRERSGTRPRRAAARPSSCGFRSQQIHSRNTGRLQRTRPACSQVSSAPVTALISESST